MAVDREFGVYSWALGVPWNPCNRAAEQAPDDEGDGRVGGGAAGQAPSGGRWTGQPRESKKLENQYVLEHFTSKCCFSICFS